MARRASPLSPSAGPNDSGGEGLPVAPRATDLMNENVTQLLLRWGDGDRAALDALMPIVERELRQMAARHLRRERPGHTLQPTALVNEAYVKLIEQQRARWQNRAQFFAVAARMMRR
ncbi:MAG: ECF-type sigma factor, partial [Pyrinomonadaceae bacterium]